MVPLCSRAAPGLDSAHPQYLRRTQIVCQPRTPRFRRGDAVERALSPYAEDATAPRPGARVFGLEWPAVCLMAEKTGARIRWRLTGQGAWWGRVGGAVARDRRGA